MRRDDDDAVVRRRARRLKVRSELAGRGADGGRDGYPDGDRVQGAELHVHGRDALSETPVTRPVLDTVATDFLSTQ